jgi:hypothetical protein
MKQHFYVEDHKPNTHIYCSDCHMRFKDNGSGNLATHRLALGISAFFCPQRGWGVGGGLSSEFKTAMEFGDFFEKIDETDTRRVKLKSTLVSSPVRYL